MMSTHGRRIAAAARGPSDLTAPPRGSGPPQAEGRVHAALTSVPMRPRVDIVRRRRTTRSAHCAGSRQRTITTPSTGAVVSFRQVQAQEFGPASTWPAARRGIWVGPEVPKHEPLTSVAPTGQSALTVAVVMAVMAIVLLVASIRPASGASAGGQSQAAASAVEGESSLHPMTMAMPTMSPPRAEKI